MKTISYLTISTEQQYDCVCYGHYNTHLGFSSVKSLQKASLSSLLHFAEWTKKKNMKIIASEADELILTTMKLSLTHKMTTLTCIRSKRYRKEARKMTAATCSKREHYSVDEIILSQLNILILSLIDGQ